MVKPSVIYSAFDEFERRHVKPREGRTLVVGSKVYEGRTDRRMRYPVSVGIDLESGEGVDLILNLEETLPYTLGHFAHVDCLSVLEHSKQPWLLAANVERLMEVGGTLYLTVPFIWREHLYPADYFRFSIDGIRSLFNKIKWTAVQYAHMALTDSTTKLPKTMLDGYPYFARTEVCAFGTRQ